jgi:hypothetical protein
MFCIQGRGLADVLEGCCQALCLLTMLSVFVITVFDDNCQVNTPPPHSHQRATWTTLAYKALIVIYYMFIYLISSMILTYLLVHMCCYPVHLLSLSFSPTSH